MNQVHQGKSDAKRSSFTTQDTIRYIWQELGLPLESLHSLELPDADQIVLPSSFKIGHLAQASSALSALAAALVDNILNSTPPKRITRSNASEQHYRLNNNPAPSAFGGISGLHETSDGHVRIHDSFPNHREAACKILGLDSATATKEAVSLKTKEWNALDLEKAAIENKAVIYALRSYQEWDSLPQSHAIPSFPITLRKLNNNPSPTFPPHIPNSAPHCLHGLRILELSRVIAAPVAGKTLSAHGASILWITSPSLPSLPSLDIDLSRGKRSLQLDLSIPEDAKILRRLISEADVFLQSYRPGALAAKGFGPEELQKLRPGIIYAHLNAWGNSGPWKENRGFDSIVQTVSGMNVSGAEYFGSSSPAKAMPVQALDHAAGYFLATGIAAAVYKRAIEGGSWEVHVSLAGFMKYLRSLGQYPGRSGFEGGRVGDVESHSEETQTGFGRLKAVRHSARIEGKEIGWDVMPEPLGSAEAVWL